MKVSRRVFLKGTGATIAGTAMPLSVLNTFASSGTLGSGNVGLPVMVMRDFSRKYDHAYLANGLIGLRPSPNPLAAAPTFVSGFVYPDAAFRDEMIAPAPYPLETDIQVAGVSMLENPNNIQIQKQTLDMANGELITEMTFNCGSQTLKLRVLQFASRAIPSLVCQEILVVPSAR